MFDTEYRDFIESKVNIGADPDTGVTLFQSQNVARARIYGAELATTWRMGEGSPALDGWTGRLDGGLDARRQPRDRRALNSIDPAEPVLGVRYERAVVALGQRTGGTAVEAQTEVDDSLADLYRDGRLCDRRPARAGRLQPAGLRLNLGPFNLTDEEYIVWADVRGRTVTDPLVPYYTRAGFNASMTLHWPLILVRGFRPCA